MAKWSVRIVSSCLWLIAWVITFLSGRWLKHSLDVLWYPQLWYRMPRARRRRIQFQFWCGRLTGHEASETECGSGGSGVWSNCRWCDKSMRVGPEHPLYRKYQFLGHSWVDPEGVMSLTEYRLASDRRSEGGGSS